MVKSWSWSASRRFAALLLCAGLAGWSGPPSEAAIEKIRHRIEISGDGKVVEKSEIVIRIDAAADLETWRFYVVPLDEHRRLVRADAWRISLDGRQERLSRQERDEVEATGDGILYSSERYLVFEPQGLEIGGRLRVETEVAVAPYFPAGSIPLRPRGESVEALDIVVQSAAGPLRHRLRGAESLEVSAGQNRLHLTGGLSGEQAVPEPASPPAAVLRYAWGPADGWQGVGRWYSNLLASVPMGGDAADAFFAQLELSPDLSRRQVLERVVEAVRREIRYVAVEVGIGGYRPTPPTEVAERRWGDCKDKSFLLIEALRRAGFEAAPALIRLDGRRRIDRELATPLEFNHLIVAVSARGLGLGEGDPVSDGWLFIDPTQTVGAATFLHRGVQDQHALVIEDGTGTLVHLPTLPSSEASDLSMTLRLGATGNAEGEVRLVFHGETAIALTQRLQASPPPEARELARTLLENQLHGSKARNVRWQGDTGGLPAFVAEAEISLLGAVRSGSLRLPAPDLLPDAKTLDEIVGWPAALAAQTARRRYELHLDPTWCVPKPRDQQLENASGSVHSHLGPLSESVFEVVHEVTLTRAWHPPEALPDLKALAVAEHRLGLRRLRFRCQ